MRIVKRLHLFMLQNFLPLFAMTFFIVLFIVLMQFLWKYIDDMVGKGLGIDVLGELFFYAAVSLVPMALPLAILLASLMTFGNLGEKFELTAMKAAGISLIRVMAPLIVLVGAIAVGAFFFQNHVLPKAQVKMWTLLFSVREKSPELEIPEGVFYMDIPDFNLLVRHKDQKTGMLYDVMLYDVSRGGDNSTILRSDSARMAFTKDMQWLYLHLYHGEQFENLREARSLDQNVPFRRENFVDKQILIPFDANFNRLDEEGMRKQYVGKNIAELNSSIDSIGRRIDSIGHDYSLELRQLPVVGVRPRMNSATGEPEKYVPVAMPAKGVNLDSLIMNLNESGRRQVLSGALNQVRNKQSDYEFKAMVIHDDSRIMRRHEIELIKKYTLSVACLIFFFIGAPLGAIIRKGGIGTPLVISVLLFLFYYIIDNTGYKMARDGRWEVWVGMWLSTFVLAPLGIYVTYKAMNDSAVFDRDAYLNMFRRMLGMKMSRRVEFKEVIIEEISVPEAVARLRLLRDHALAFVERYAAPQSYVQYWLHGYDMEALGAIAQELDDDVDYMRDCSNMLAVNKLLDFPVLRMLLVYHPSRRKWLSRLCMVLFVVGLPVYLIGLKAQSRLKEELRQTARVAESIIAVLEEQPEAQDAE